MNEGQKLIKNVLLKLRTGWWEEHFGIRMARIEENKYWIFAVGGDFNVDQMVEIISQKEV